MFSLAKPSTASSTGLPSVLLNAKCPREQKVTLEISVGKSWGYLGALWPVIAEMTAPGLTHA